jgi:site-specific recombinase XerD
MTEFFGADTPLVDITSRRVEEFIAERRKEVRACTVNKDLSVLRQMFGKAVDWKYVLVDPMSGIQNLKDDSLVHDRYLQPEEFNALLSAAIEQQGNEYPGLRYAHMPELMIVLVNTGLRLSEALTLSIPHINFDRRILSVKNVKSRRTKNGRERHIRLNEDAFNALYALRRKAVNQFGTIFQTEDGSSWLPHKRILQRQFGKCVNAAGLFNPEPTQNVTVHTLRHTFGSHLALNGVPVGKIQYLMGHTSLRTTERYMHLAPAETYGDTAVLEGMATNWQPKQAAYAAN